MVRLHVTANLPIRVEPLAFANRVELRFGQAFPAVLIVDRDALPQLIKALVNGQEALDASPGPVGGGR